MTPEPVRIGLHPLALIALFQLPLSIVIHVLALRQLLYAERAVAWEPSCLSAHPKASVYSPRLTASVRIWPSGVGKSTPITVLRGSPSVVRAGATAEHIAAPTNPKPWTATTGLWKVCSESMSISPVEYFVGRSAIDVTTAHTFLHTVANASAAPTPTLAPRSRA